MGDEVCKDSSTRDVTESFHLSGRKVAFIFTWSSDRGAKIDPNQRDVETMVETLKNQDFDFNDMKYLLAGGEIFDSPASEVESFDSSDSDVPEEKVKSFTAFRDFLPMDLDMVMSIIAERVKDASCIFIYFIVCQSCCQITWEFKIKIPVYRMWGKFKNIDCPKLFVVQVNFNKDEKAQSTLMNSDFKKGESSSIPDTANVLLAYLPNFADATVSVADILKEELKKPYDFQTNLTSVIDKVKLSFPMVDPKFSSTLLKKLYLTESPMKPKDLQPTYHISKQKKCLAYAFLFGEFEVCPSLTALIDFSTKQMTEAFNTLGFNFDFCVKDGHMTVKEFREKLAEILQDKEKMTMCECIMIFISSHGERRGIIYASDGFISKDLVVSELSTCKELDGKPKLLFIDACRGAQFERPAEYASSSQPPNTNEHSSNTMYSMRWLHSVYEDDLNRLNYYECSKTSDMMLVMSSVEGRVSVFSLHQGSHFIRNLCEKLTKYGKDYDLMTILTLTMDTVAHVDMVYEGMVLKQQITFTSSLRKLLRFPK